MLVRPQARVSLLPSLACWHRWQMALPCAPVTAARHPRRVSRAVLACSANNNQELLATLQDLSDDEIESWAASNMDQITISFLSWIADLEAAAAGAERERLWALGSRLMALREGFTPLAASQLGDQLAAAGEAAAAATAALAPRGPGPLADAVRTNAALGLTVEGMGLLEQQAAALEATMGAQRAAALTEILGRKAVKAPEEAAGLMAADAAGRILEVLVQIESREDRAAMLPEAFTPPSSAGAVVGAVTSDDGEEDAEEELYTTPLQLLQAVDLWLQRAQESSGGSGGARAAPLLTGSALGLEPWRLVEVLEELREDILGAWESSSGDDF